MGAIREFNFNDFTSAIKNQLGNAFDAKVEENMQGLKSIFNEAAKNDGDENDELFETYEGGKFNELVKKGVDFVLKTIVENMGEKIKATLDNLFHKDKKDEKSPLTEKQEYDGNGTISEAEAFWMRAASKPNGMTQEEILKWQRYNQANPKKQ